MLVSLFTFDVKAREWAGHPRMYWLYVVYRTNPKQASRREEKRVENRGRVRN